MVTRRLGAVISCGLQSRRVCRWRRRLSRSAGRRLRPGPPVRLQPVCPCPPIATCVLACRFRFPEVQKMYAAVRRTSPASAAARGAQLPSPMALSCIHRSASSRVGRAPPVVASVHHSSPQCAPGRGPEGRGEALDRRPCAQRGRRGPELIPAWY